MTLHTQVVLVLLFGLYPLYVLFGTRVLLDGRSLRALVPRRRGESIPSMSSWLLALDMACTISGAHFLLFGRKGRGPWLHPAMLHLCVPIPGSALYKQARMR